MSYTSLEKIIKETKTKIHSGSLYNKSYIQSLITQLKLIYYIFTFYQNILKKRIYDAPKEILNSIRFFYHL